MTDRTDWLEWRRTGIGASDVPALLGLSAWTTPWALWADKIGLLDLDDTDGDTDDRKEFGTEIEPALARMFTRRTRLAVIGAQSRLTHPEHEWALATVDGFVADYEGPDPLEAVSTTVELGPRRIWRAPEPDVLGVWEAKSRGGTLGWDEIPLDVQAQVQWQMFVAGVDHAWITVEHTGSFGGKKLGIYELDRDDADIGFMFTRAERFWHDHVLAGDPPPVDASAATTDALTAAWREVRGEPAVDLTPLADVHAQWVKAKADIKTMERIERHLANQLRAALGVHTEGFIDGQLAVSWRSHPESRIDLAAVRADHGAQYDIESTKRTLRPHHAKEK